MAAAKDTDIEKKETIHIARKENSDTEEKEITEQVRKKAVKKSKDAAKAPAAEELTIEEGMDRLEQILKTMEDSSTSLEDSFKLYEEGLAFVKSINNRIEQVKQRIDILDEE